MSQEANIHSVTYEDLLLFKVLSGCTDTKIQKEMLKLKEPTLKQLQALGTEWDGMKKDNKAAINPSAQSQVSQSSNQKCGHNQGQSSLKQSTWEKLKGKGKRCAQNHKGERCKFVDAVCNTCGKKGHISPTCYKSDRRGGYQKQNKARKQESNASSAASSAANSAASSRANSPSSDGSSDTGKASQMTH